MLCEDALYLLDYPDMQQVANQTVEFTSYLWELHQQGRLRTDFKRLEVSLGHHVRRHLQALGGPAVGPASLAPVPGLRVHTIDRGCCWARRSVAPAGCRWRRGRASGRSIWRVAWSGDHARTLVAYGLMPESRHRMRQPVDKRVLW